MIWIGDVDWYLFGSHALGTADEHSDLDLMFEGPAEADLAHPFWQRQKSYFDAMCPDVEVWLCEDDRLLPLTSHSNVLDNGRGIIDYARSYRVRLTQEHLRRLLTWFRHKGREPICDQRVYEQRAFFKYSTLEDKMKAWRLQQQCTTPQQ